MSNPITSFPIQTMDLDAEKVPLDSESLEADNVKDGLEEVNDKFASYRTSSAQDVIDSALRADVDYLIDNQTITDWLKIQEIVRGGRGAKFFPVGHQFNVPHTTYGSIIFDVGGHDQIASASGKQHTMTLLAHNCIANVQFDAAEAFYYCATALPAGTYHMTVVGWGQTQSGTYQFTTPAQVPAGGQLCLSGGPYGTAITSLKVVAYTAKGGTTEVWASADRPVITVGTGGTYLGSWNDALNHIQRISYGSSNYGQSAIRQLINSDADAGTFWTPQTIFDRAPSWNASTDGFLKGIDSNFLAVVDTAKVKCSTNNTYESPDSAWAKNTAYELHDRFFLASRMETFGSSDVVDGSVLMSYFVGATNDDRIKLLSGSPRYWWLRTPNSDQAHITRIVYPDGSLSNGYANGSYGCVPACIIA